MANQPKNRLVSCVCLTYNRPQLVEEAIQCFIDQTYNNKELIVLCDNPNCLFVLEPPHPQVRVINVWRRFPNLGSKYNYVKNFIQGDYVCIWEDDDLFGFNRIEEQVRLFAEIEERGEIYDVVKGKLALFSLDNKDYSIGGNLYHSQSCFTAEFFHRTKFLEASFGIDCEFESQARAYWHDPSPLHWYVYRWGNCGHLSGHGDHPQAWAKSVDLKLKGEIRLNPQYHQNYWQDIYQFYIGNNTEHAGKWKTLYKEYIMG